MKTTTEIQLKINDCIRNKSKYVEWLCENKTERRLGQLLKRFDTLYEFAVRNKIVKHIELIDLWKEQANSALAQLYNFDNLYFILKKIRKGKKLNSHEKIVMDCNYEWFVNRIYGLTAEEIKIVGEK